MTTESFNEPSRKLTGDEQLLLEELKTFTLGPVKNKDGSLSTVVVYDNDIQHYNIKPLPNGFSEFFCTIGAGEIATSEFIMQENPLLGMTNVQIAEHSHQINAL